VSRVSVDFELLIKNNPKQLHNFTLDLEAKDYCGCNYTFLNHSFIQRTAKITPKKVGQFVTLWKRDQLNITTPISTEDGFQFVIILCQKGDLKGKFVFPVGVLLKKGIINDSKTLNAGKRGFRVYPDWDKPVSTQAIKTQEWQQQFFSRSFLLDINLIL
jgi:hypothetical protein